MTSTTTDLPGVTHYNAGSSPLLAEAALSFLDA
jgi:hypothetical protein